MHVLRDAGAIEAAGRATPDPHLARLFARAVAFLREYDDQWLNVILVEPRDTLQGIDLEMGQAFLMNHASGTQLGDPDFKPSFETLEEHPTFYDMVFIVGDEGFAVEVLIPKLADVDPWLLDFCAKHATPFREAET